MKDKYDNDCLSGFCYASVELEAFGGETIFTADGPPNGGEPVIRNVEDILSLTPPRSERLPWIAECA